VASVSSTELDNLSMEGVGEAGRRQRVGRIVWSRSISSKSFITIDRLYLKVNILALLLPIPQIQIKVNQELGN
jgi:hypothetical protein